MATAEERRALAEDEEERELESDTERTNSASLASLTAHSARLSTRLDSLRRTKSQLAEAITQERRQRAEAERRIEEEKSRLLHHSTSGHSLPPLSSLLSSSLPSDSAALNHTLRELALTAKHVEEIMAKGVLEEEEEERTTASGTQTTKRRSMGLADGSLPSMSSERLSAFSADVYGAVAPARLTASTIATNTTSAGTSATSTTTADVSPSPYLLHQRSLCAAYLQLDDLWAKALNTLFKALFGGANAAGGNAGKESFGDEVIKHSKEHLAERAEMEAIVSATPHGKHTRMRMHSQNAGSVTPARGSTAGGTITPARGRIGGGLTRTQSIPLETTEEEEPSTSGGGGFTTPPSHSGNGSSSQRNGSATNSAGSPPTTASSLSPSLHAHYTAELTRLYDSFPASQDYWLAHNLLFLSVRARTAEQHALMVREDAYRAMSKQQVNEQLAEVGLQTAAMQRQLAAMLSDGSDSSLPLSDTSPLPAGGFPALWHSLRGLQLLELLRADLSFASSRQARYLASQTSLQHSLLSQKARHEILLGAWRMEHARVAECAHIAQECQKDVTRVGEAWQERMASYSHLSSLHSDTATMLSPDRLGIDSRAGFLGRVARIANSAAGQAQRAEGAVTQEEKTPEAFSTLLSSSTTLLNASSRLRASMLTASQERAGQLRTLVEAAQDVRRDWLADGMDVIMARENPLLAAAAAADRKENDTAVLANQARLDAQEFAQLHAEVSRAVEQVADGLNALTLQVTQQRSFVDGSGDPLAQTHAQLGDVATRAVFTEFIQAPELLEERVAQLKKRLAASEMR